ncbi:MAG: F0F1 ATP synthase subunit A [Planctomycetota bacterium]
MIQTTLLIPTLAAGDPVAYVIPKFIVGPFHNQLIMGTVAAVLLLVLLMGLAKRLGGEKKTNRDYVVKGTGWQLLETICVFIRENVARPNLGKLTDKYVPYLWTVFFFILFCNLLGMMPFAKIAAITAHFLGGDTYFWAKFGGTATGTIAMTIPLALVAFVVINVAGIKEAGVDYFKHFNPGPIFMAPLLVPLEVMGLFIKSAVLAMRLFGTMMAGHLVIAAFIGLVGLAAGAASGLMIGIGVTIMGAALMGLELFIAMLQAFIFTFLTTLFIAQGAVHHHDDEHGHDHEHAPDSHDAEPAHAAPAVA